MRKQLFTNFYYALLAVFSWTMAELVVGWYLHKREQRELYKTGERFERD